MNNRRRTGFLLKDSEAGRDTLMRVSGQGLTEVKSLCKTAVTGKVMVAYSISLVCSAFLEQFQSINGGQLLGG